MSISAIGNTYTYVYNTETKKLSTANGTEDDFVKYFNGDIEGSESETLNGFDAQRKGDFERILMLIGWGKLAHNQIGNNTEIKISGTIVDGDTTEYTINDEAVFTAYVAPSFTYSEYQEISDIWASGEDYACTNDNGYPYPDSVYNKVLQRYEEWLYQPLSARANTSDIAEKSFISKAYTRDESLSGILHEKIEEMKENIEAGNVDNEPVIQIGGKAYTEEEWDKLLQYVDDAEKEMQEAIDAAKEQALEEAENSIKKDAETTQASQGTEEVTETTAPDTNKTENPEEVEEPTLIEKSESTLITSEYTECTFSNQDPEKKDEKYVTWYTEDGIYCEDVNGSVGNNWMLFWDEEGQYEKVMDFINQFPDDFKMLFACNQTFWKDFLNDEIDMEAFMEFMETTDNGIPDYLIEEGDSVYVDKEKVQKWAKYTNKPGGFRPLERVDEFGNPFPDKEYVDERTGFRWKVNVHGEPYMLGSYAEDFYRHCEKTGADPTKKFAELTGLLQYLPDGSYAYIGSNGISIKSKDGQKLFLDKEDMTYDMLMYMFDNLPATDDYFNPEYWQKNMEAAKEAVPKEEFFKYEPEEGKYEKIYIDPRDIVYQY